MDMYGYRTMKPDIEFFAWIKVCFEQWFNDYPQNNSSYYFDGLI